MTLWLFLLELLAIAYIAGLLGSLTGIGGGIVITPALVLLFHVNIHYAMGASLISVMVTSSGAAITYLREGYTNMRIGMLLAVAAVIGALLGALLLTALPVSIIAIIFGCVLIFSAYFAVSRHEDVVSPLPSHPWAVVLNLESSYATPQGIATYKVHRVPLAMGLIAIAGSLATLLGIGSGALKVLAMDQAMGLPYRVSTATSNFMIGITATVSAGIYLSLGYIDPILAFPIIMGVLGGSMMGAKYLKYLPVRALRYIFGVVVFLIALQMIYKGITGGL